MTHPGIGGDAGTQAARATYERLMEEFGRGWEAARPSAMAEVFSEDATFVASPFEPALRGRTAIADYWGDVPQEQAAITFRSGEIFAAGPWFATEFTCTFRRIKTGDWVQVSGAFFCETTGEKISEMRMYWERSRIVAP
jgi:ketosteroid isomerase-like protein